MSSLIPQITCIIPVVPFDYVMEGTTSKNKRMHCSVYTFHGRDISYTPSELLDMGMKEWLRRAKNAEGYGFRRFMRYGYDQMKPYLTEKSRIKVENINADILLFASANDDCWPSDEAVPRIVDKLEECNYSRKVEYHVFEKGSHLLPGGLDRLSIISRTIIKKMIFAENKYPRECEEARQTCMKRMIEFIRDWE